MASIDFIKWLRANPREYKEFKKYCLEAEAGSVFMFHGHEVLRDYAKYVIEYVDHLENINA